MKRTFFFLLSVLVLGCTADEQFTDSPTALLTLPADVSAGGCVRLDTVFSRVSSQAYSFWLHNDGSRALRIADARLADGTRGFRVNVDGQFAQPAVSNVDVLGGDSLLIFVALTPAPTGQPQPVELTDELLLTLASGAVQRVPLKGWAWDAAEWHDLTVVRDTVVDASRPVHVYGTLTVAPGAELTLRGAQLFFHDQAGIAVSGTLRTADGTLLRGDRLDRMFAYLPYDRISGQWQGVSVAAGGTAELTDTELHGAQCGVSCAEGSRLTLTRTVVHNCDGPALAATGATLTATRCQLSNAAGPLLALSGGAAELTRCTLAQFYPFAADRGPCLTATDGAQLAADGLLLAAYGAVLPADWAVDYGGTATDGTGTDGATDGSGADGRGADGTPTAFSWASADGTVQLTQCVVGSKRDFLTVDEDNLTYDFHLAPTSAVTDAGCY